MSRTHHFFVLSRPDPEAPAWPIEEMRQTLSGLSLRPNGSWFFASAGRLLVGWLGAGGVNTNAPFLLHAGDLAEPDNDRAGRPEFPASLVDGNTAGEFPLDGTFAACAVEPRSGRATLITDHFGLFPLYRLEQNGVYGFSTSLRALTALLRPACHVDASAVYEMLGLHMVLGNRTFFREITLVPPATVLHLNGAEPTASTYWSWERIQAGAEETPRRERDYVHETFAQIQTSVMRSIRGSRKIAVSLSGGLDSRLLCAILAKNDVPFQTYNIDFGVETSIARTVAELLRVPMHVMPMLPRPSVPMTQGHDAIDCLYDVNQTWGWEMAERAAQDGCDIILDGLAFDTILGAVHRVQGDTPEALAVGLKGNYQETDVNTLARVTGIESAERIEASLNASLRTQAAECLREAGPRASEYFTMQNRVRRFTFGYGLCNLHHLHGAYPYVARSLFETCLRLPLELRLEHRLYRRIYCELFPELARVPWAKTRLPLDRYGPTRDQTRWHRKLDAFVRRATLGRVTLAGKGSIDAEFRRRPEMRAPFLHRLRDSGPANLHGLIPAETVSNILWWQGMGRNYGVLLQTLLTVENFLARFVKDGPVSLLN